MKPLDEDGWIKNEGQAPELALVDIKLNEDEEEWPGVPMIRFGVEPRHWDWSERTFCAITHYRPSTV